MFSTFKQRLLLGVYIFLILSIPIGAYLASQYQNIKSSAEQKSSQPIVRKTPKVATPSAKELLSNSENTLGSSDSPSSSSTTDTSPTIATSFGPTLSLKATLEGRPADNQATKLFVGIVEGALSTNPKFLLSFTVDLPASGIYSNLSLAGLTTGANYTALLKGSTQIATSSAFLMSPTVTNLNDGQPLPLLTGDLNEDNVINSADYSIIQKAFGSTTGSPNWNENADFNKDGVINTFDLAIVSRNLEKIGASGAWTSPLPNSATPSAGLSSPSNFIGSPGEPSAGGYWIWVPKL